MVSKMTKQIDSVFATASQGESHNATELATDRVSRRPQGFGRTGGKRTGWAGGWRACAKPHASSAAGKCSSTSRIRTKRRTVNRHLIRLDSHSSLRCLNRLHSLVLCWSSNVLMTRFLQVAHHRLCDSLTVGCPGFTMLQKGVDHVITLRTLFGTGSPHAHIFIRTSRPLRYSSSGGSSSSMYRINVIRISVVSLPLSTSLTKCASICIWT